MHTVLFICTANSRRSIMAEALLNQLARGTFKAWSAGVNPIAEINPVGIETLRRHNIDPGKPYTKSWNEFSTKKFDFIVSLDDTIPEETWPLFPGNPKKIHWSIDDPLKAPPEELQSAFEKTYLELEKRILELIGRGGFKAGSPFLKDK